MSSVYAVGKAGPDPVRPVITFLTQCPKPGAPLGFKTAQGSFVGAVMEIDVTVNPDGSSTAVVEAAGAWNTPGGSDFITPVLIYRKASPTDKGSIQINVDGTVPLNQDGSLDTTGLLPLTGSSSMSIVP